jgi:hypothetical protein
MLKIRKEQMTSFEKIAAQRFEDQMVEHLRNFAPKHFKVLEESDVRRVIQLGIDKARSHRFTSERSIRLYIEMMFMMGSGFDSDPLLPWAAEILSDESLQLETERIDRLNEKAWDYVDHVLKDYKLLEKTGDKSKLVEELRKIKEESDEPISPNAISEFYSRGVARLKQMFPEKCEYVGELSLRRLIQRAIEQANGYGITTQKGVVIFAAMMFILGSGFDKDPQLPWASAALNNPSNIDQHKKVDQLYSSAIICLKKWWA